MLTSLNENPAFGAYAITTVVLSLNLVGLWAYSGKVRSKVKITLNSEDAKGGATKGEVEPEDVARVLRAYANAQSQIVPFLLLALNYVVLGASLTAAYVLFSVFVVARYAHSIAYVNAQQPARSIAYGLAGFPLLVLLEENVRLALPLLCHG